MILSFKTQFKQPILDDTKIHTIRADKTNRWQAGKKIHFATGVRTKNYHCFKEGVCTTVQKIEIEIVSDYLHETIVKIDDRKLTELEVQQLAWNDGFDSLVAFWMWFNTDFEGKIIHWADFKY